MINALIQIIERADKELKTYNTYNLARIIIDNPECNKIQKF